MSNAQFPTARKSGLVVQELPGELLVYDTENNKAHCLNQTAAFVWKACDGKKSAADISDLYKTESGAGLSEEVVWLAIDQLNENALLEHQVRTVFAGQSRREVLKKIGFTSIVALPVIASLVAPRNAMAASSCTCANDVSCLAPQRPPGCPSGTSCDVPNSVCVP